MFNLRETREHHLTTKATAAISSALTTTSVLLHTLTNVEDVDEVAIHDPLSNKEGLFYHDFFCGHGKEGQLNYAIHTEIEMVQVVDHRQWEGA